MSAPVPKTLRPGGMIGDKLTIVQRLDRRGDDPVLLVWDHASWSPAVCKVFRSERRARREATALAALAHPNIVRCLRVEPPSYVLMEHLEGPSLGHLLEQRAHGRLPVADALRVAIHVGAALQHIHGRGFLHLDVKPDNIMIVHGRPVLFDFGALRLRGGVRTAQVHGTDAYIAPEEWRSEDVDTPADVFSLGVTLFEMLTGQQPFGPSSRSYARRKGATAKPLGHYRPRVGARLEALVARCVAHDPAVRPSLVALLPALNAEIGSGPRMWPAALALDRRRRLRPAGPQPGIVRATAENPSAAWH